jgi:hypothetical protein
VLAPKKDGTFRFCVNYCKLNAVTKTMAYPLPRIDYMLDHLANAKYFSTMDLASGIGRFRFMSLIRKGQFLQHTWELSNGR